MQRKKILIIFGLLAVFSIVGTVYAYVDINPAILPAVEFESKANSISIDTSNIKTPIIPSYTSIKERMLNAVDNFNTVQGTFREKFSPINLDQTIDFNISEVNGLGSYVKITDNLTKDTQEISSDGKSILTLNNKTKTSNSTDVTKTLTGKIIGARESKTEKGEPVYNYRTDPAFSNIASEVILPQVYAFWLNDETNNYKVTGEDIFLGRNVTLIEGTHDAILAKKHNATQFNMWVDTETGVLLKLIETNANGEVTNSIEVSSISFNQNIDHLKFSTVAPESYTDIHSK
jgi:outer membrane lipoprotein-sorting protein